MRLAGRLAPFRGRRGWRFADRRAASASLGRAPGGGTTVGARRARAAVGLLEDVAIVRRQSFEPALVGDDHARPVDAASRRVGPAVIDPVQQPEAFLRKEAAIGVEHDPVEDVVRLVLRAEQLRRGQQRQLRHEPGRLVRRQRRDLHRALPDLGSPASGRTSVDAKAQRQRISGRPDPDVVGEAAPVGLGGGTGRGIGGDHDFPGRAGRPVGPR